MVKPLADNGGPVPTQMSHLFGPAIDTRPCGTGNSFDARGQRRAANTGCDKGAVESQPGEPTGADCIGPLTPAGVLSFGDYSRCDLSGINLAARVAEGLQLPQANLTATDFSSAILTGSNLTEADAAGAKFPSADMTNVQACETNFTNADLLNATTTGAIFDDAFWNNTTCPDGTNSNDNGNTCVGHLQPAPQAPEGPGCVTIRVALLMLEWCGHRHCALVPEWCGHAAS